MMEERTGGATRPLDVRTTALDDGVVLVAVRGEVDAATRQPLAPNWTASSQHGRARSSWTCARWTS